MRAPLVFTLAWGLAGCSSDGPTDPPPPVPTAGPEIAFDRAGTGSDFDIWVASADGSNKRPVANSAELEWRPHYAADGSQLYYMRAGSELTRANPDGSNAIELARIATNNTVFYDLHSTAGIIIRGGTGGVWTVDLDGQNLTQLTPSTSAILDYWPRWSPNGSQITFVRRPGQLPSDLYVMSADGSSQLLLAASTNFIDDHDWHPDGDRILVAITSVAGRDLFSVQADGAGSTQITASGTAWDPEWSRDGTRIAYRDGASADDWVIVVAQADGSNPSIVAEGTDPGWSHDGSRIAFCRRLGSNIIGLATVRPDGTDAAVIDDNGSFCTGGGFVDRSYSWRPGS